MEKQNSMNVDELLAKLEQILRNYENIHNLGNLSNIAKNGALSDFLDVSQQDISNMTVDKCAELSFIYSKYAFYLQYLYNKESGVYKWTERKIHEFTCNKLDDYDKFMKYEVKVYNIARENEVVKKIKQIQSHAEQNMERINGLSASLKHISEAIRNVQIIKSMRIKESNYE